MRGSPAGSWCWAPPIGSAQFTRAKLQNCIDEERRLWEIIPNVPDLQCGGKSCCSVNPRANHTMRTLHPPHPSHQSMAANMTRAFGTQPGHCWARFRARWMLSKMLASLPMRMGGLCLRSAERCAASWADALYIIAQKNPPVAETVVQFMSDEINPGEGMNSRR